MKRLLRSLIGVTPLLLLAQALPACSGETAPRKGQIMLALQTDMSIPDDVSHVRIIVFKNGALKFDQKYKVGKDGDQIPATLGVVASDNAADTTEVRVLSYQGGTVRTLNRAVTTIPQDRIATLRVPIEWLCDGQVVPSEGIPDSYDSACASPDESCVAGRCEKVKIDPETLPDFEIQEITGGAADPTRGLCFDTGPCLDGGHDLVPDAKCVVTVPSEALLHLNVGVLLPEGRGGICGDSGSCYIPLDRSDTRGWQVIEEGAETTTVQLPPAVCDKLESGDAASIRASAVCITKTASTPTCGPWTSIGTQNSEKDPDPTRDPGFVEPDPDPKPEPEPEPEPEPVPNTECPGLSLDSAAPIAQNAEIDHYARLMLEAQQRMRDVRLLVADGCASVAESISGARPEYDAKLPTDSEIEAACLAAKEALPANTNTWHANISLGACRAAATEQLSLEAACNVDASCDFGSFEARCVPRQVSCDGSCDGECSPGDGMLNVTCNGMCHGQCVGACDGPCYGPGGNPLPSDECVGECQGHCSGTCQGQCMTTEPCGGTCSGACSGEISAEFCAGPLDLPSCAAALSCTNLAAASAAIHRQCLGSLAYFSGRAAEGVAPAVAGQLPTLLMAQNVSFGLSRATGYLDGAARALDPVANGSPDAACFAQAKQLLGPILDGLTFADSKIEALVPLLSGSPTPLENGCNVNAADDACSTCMKTNCCNEMLACGSATTCNTEQQCYATCLAGGGTPAACGETCGSGGKLSADTNAILVCQSNCAACRQPTTGGTCLAFDTSGMLLDDFEDGDVVSPFGNWRLTDPVDLETTLTTIAPGASASLSALGAAGGKNSGLSLDLNTCIDASGSSALAFEAKSPATQTGLLLTLQVRTRGTETPAKGGNCEGAACGDHFKIVTTFPAGGSFTTQRQFWGQVVNSLGQPPDLKNLLGLDFIIDGGVAIDNVRLEPQSGG